MWVNRAASRSNSTMAKCWLSGKTSQLDGSPRAPEKTGLGPPA